MTTLQKVSLATSEEILIPEHVTGIVHEIKNPISICYGYCEFLLSQHDTLSLDNRKVIYELIKQNLERLDKLVSNIKIAIQMGQNHFQIRKHVINVKEFLSTILNSYQHRLGDELTFENCIDEQVVQIIGDEIRLRQAIENVFENAIKQTKQTNRVISVKVECTSSNSIRVVIRDNGVGIEKKHLSEIFEQFVSIPTKSAASGTGMGLHLSREILKAHGGTIMAKSDGLNRGASFVIEIPTVEPGFLE